MTGSYDDIIDLPHPTSTKHPRMPLSDRAAQFSPFAALTGHGAAIAETARLTDRRIELNEDARADLDRKQKLLLALMAEQPTIAVTWFQPDEKKEDGRYITTTGNLKRIEETRRVLTMADRTTIPLDAIVGIESDVFRWLDGAE